jgi:hypothetical protein
MEYDLEMIEGCLLDVREWLKYHTSIQWQVRGENGHSKPLCKFLSRGSRHKSSVRPRLARSYSRPGSFEDEKRWKGYPGRVRTYKRQWEEYPLVRDQSIAQCTMGAGGPREAMLLKFNLAPTMKTDPDLICSLERNQDPVLVRRYLDAPETGHQVRLVPLMSQ